MKRYIKASEYSQEELMWAEICQAYANSIGAELLFVNSDNFGIETKDGQLLHIYADELAEMLKNSK